MLWAPDGSKCALGCLIPDFVYDTRMELHFSVDPRAPERLAHFLGHDVPLCMDLMRLHDKRMIHGWTEDAEFFAECIADKHNLWMPR